jgi:hypothetical protein
MRLTNGRGSVLSARATFYRAVERMYDEALRGERTFRDIQHRELVEMIEDSAEKYQKWPTGLISEFNRSIGLGCI